MVDLITICYTDAIVSFQEFPWMGCISCLLVFIQDNLFFPAIPEILEELNSIAAINSVVAINIFLFYNFLFTIKITL